MSDSIRCRLCDTVFKYQKNLNRHLEDLRCKAIENPKMLHERFEKLECQIPTRTSASIMDTTTTESATANGNNNNVTNIVNPITDIHLHIGYISPLEYRELIESADGDTSFARVSMLVGEYLAKVMCDPKHPENQSVKYTKKHPPTFEMVVPKTNDDDVSIESVTKGLTDASVLMSKPVKTILTKKSKQCKRNDYREEDYDETLHEDVHSRVDSYIRDDGKCKKMARNFLNNVMMSDAKMKS